MKKHLLSILFLLIIVILIAYLNTPHGVFLTGWDNLHPEFNVPLNIFRSIFSVWQEYQGVGSLSGMGHSANLVYELILYPFSFILPMNLLRFFWNYLMLFLGPLGMYFLQFSIHESGEIKSFQQNKNANPVILERVRLGGRPIGSNQKDSIPYRPSGSRVQNDNVFFSLLGALFYLSNLATLQSFYAPLEVFTTHFASLPWIFLTTIIYFKHPSRKNLFFFAIVLLFFVGQGYVPTVFFVSLLSFLVLTTTFYLFNRTKQNLFSFAKMLLTIFCVNAFWLLPFTYFTLTSSHIPVEAKINQMSTNSIFLQNKEFGKLTDVALLKGFWFNNLDPSNTNSELMMLPWRNYSNQWYIELLGFIFFAIVLVGVFYAVKKRTPITLSFVILFFLSITALTTATPPFSWINDILRTHFPLVNQAYRFPFTKFSLLTASMYSIFFAIGIKQIINKPLSLWERGRVRATIEQSNNPFFYIRFLLIYSLLICLFGSLLIFYMLPLFQGHLFYEKEKVAIPKEYFALFSYFQKQNPNKRIATLPQNTFWSWPFYRWPAPHNLGDVGGYQGSGFIWYGLPQAVMDRAFDPWSSYNENYYWELSQALYSQDTKSFEQTLSKYQISYLILDKNQYNPANSLLFINPNIEDFLASIPSIKKIQTFGNILVYSVQNNSPNTSVFLTPSLIKINSPKWNNIDTFYNSFGNYSTDNYTPNIWYPFPALFSEHQNSINISQTEKSILLQTIAPENTPNVLHVPIFTKDEDAKFYITLTPPLSVTGFDIASSSASVQIQPGNDNIFKAEIQKVTDPFTSISFTPNKQTFNTQNCDTLRNGPMQITQDSQGITITSTNTTACLSKLLPFLPHNLGFVLFITAKHIKGQTLHVWVSNPKENFLPLDTYLPDNKNGQIYAFILPPLESFTTSYLLQIENISIGDTTTNSLNRIDVYPIPYDFLKNLSISNSLPTENRKTTIPLHVSHPNPSLYEITLEPTATKTYQTLVLSQAYDPGWHAYSIRNTKYKIRHFEEDSALGVLNTIFPFLFGTELKNHIKVNNWENGWTLENCELRTKNCEHIVLLYLPQYLEYIGFLLLLIPLFLLIATQT